MSTESVEIVEVGPRDGLQNEAELLETASKAAFVDRLLDAGARRIEVVSFAHPARVPQMADAEALLELLPRDRGATYVGLVLNARGFERARAAGIEEINYVVVASETFSQRNQGMSISENLSTWSDIAARARAAGMRPTATLSSAFGCGYEGEVPLARVVELALRCVDAGAQEIAVADTIGAAVPPEVTERFGAVAEAVGDVPLRGHFHNTRNTGLANVVAAYAAGVRHFDTSCGGIGGCPFAPRATGNVPTEDVAWMLERMGVHTGLDLDALMQTSRWLEGELGHGVPSLVTRAGVFPPAGARP